MRYLYRAVPVIVAVAILLPAGCDNKPAPPATTAALAHPVLQLDVKAGRVLVPQSAVVERGGIPGVFVLTEANQARFRMVRRGKIVNDRVEILSGLGGNETLITGDLSGVHDGSLIRPPSMAEVPGAKPSMKEDSFTGQTQEQFPGQKKY